MPVRIDNSLRTGESFTLLMVVSYNEPHAAFVDVFGFVNGGYTVIDGHDELYAILCDPVYRIVVESVALGALRNVVYNISAYLREVGI